MQKKILTIIMSAILAVSFAASAYAEPAPTEPVTEATTEPTVTTTTQSNTTPPTGVNTTPPNTSHTTTASTTTTSATASETSELVLSEDTEESETTPETTAETTTSTTASTTVSTTVPPDTILALDVHTLNLDEGDTYQLNPSYENPAEDTSIRFYSQNIYVARSNDNGLITATGGGTTVIFAVNDATGAWDSVTVNVTAREVVIEPTGISVETESLDVTTGFSVSLNAAVEPAGTDRAIIYQANDTSIATIDAYGNITGVSEGNTYVTATVEGTDFSKAVAVNVHSAETIGTISFTGHIYNQDGNAAAGIRLSIDGQNMVVSDTAGYFHIEGIEAGNYTLTANDGVAVYSIDENISGNTDTYLLLKNGKLDSYSSFSELQPMFDIKSYKFTESTLQLKPNETYQLQYEYTPETSMLNSIVYESSNDSVATVGQDGIVTAKKTGVVEIYLTLNGSEKKATVSLTVMSDDSSENSIYIVIVEMTVIIIAIAVFIIMFKKYRKKYGSENDM